MLSKPLLKKYAHRMASMGGTCDTGDILDCMLGDHIPATLEDAEYVAELAGDLLDQLGEKSDGWEKLREAQ